MIDLSIMWTAGFYQGVLAIENATLDGQECMT